MRKEIREGTRNDNYGIDLNSRDMMHVAFHIISTSTAQFYFCIEYFNRLRKYCSSILLLPSEGMPNWLHIWHIDILTNIMSSSLLRCKLWIANYWINENRISDDNHHQCSILHMIHSSPLAFFSWNACRVIRDTCTKFHKSECAFVLFKWNSNFCWMNLSMSV